MPPQAQVTERIKLALAETVTSIQQFRSFSFQRTVDVVPTVEDVELFALPGVAAREMFRPPREPAGENQERRLKADHTMSEMSLVIGDLRTTDAR